MVSVKGVSVFYSAVLQAKDEHLDIKIPKNQKQPS